MDEEQVEIMVMYDRTTRGSSWGIFDMPNELADLVLGSDEAEDDDDSDECACECGCCKPLCENANACDGDEGLCHCWHEACECGQQRQASGYN